jgi:hypothetical protein
MTELDEDCERREIFRGGVTRAGEEGGDGVKRDIPKAKNTKEESTHGNGGAGKCAWAR